MPRMGAIALMSAVTTVTTADRKAPKAGRITVVKTLTIAVNIVENTENTIPRIVRVTATTSLRAETMMPSIDRRRPILAAPLPFTLGYFLKLRARTREMIARTIDAMGATVDPIKGMGRIIRDKEIIPRTSAAVPLPLVGASGSMGSVGVAGI